MASMNSLFERQPISTFSIFFRKSPSCKKMLKRCTLGNLLKEKENVTRIEIVKLGNKCKPQYITLINEVPDCLEKQAKMRNL